MTMKKDLDKTISKYLTRIFETFNFVLYEDNAQGMGALKKYKNDYLKILILNDRGIININISPIFDKEDFRDIEIINSLIVLEKLSLKETNKWEREKILDKRLDLKEQANFIKDYWSLLVKLYDENNYRFTIKDLNKLGLERSRLILG